MGQNEVKPWMTKAAREWLIPAEMRTGSANEFIEKLARVIAAHAPAEPETKAAPAQSLYEAPHEWINEDELPKGYPYDAMFPHSKLGHDGRGGVRIFPKNPSLYEAPLRHAEAKILAAIMDSLIAQNCPDSVSGYKVMDAVRLVLESLYEAPKEKEMTLREEFERWAIKNAPMMPLYWNEKDGKYSWIHAVLAFEAYSAGRKEGWEAGRDAAADFLERHIAQRMGHKQVLAGDSPTEAEMIRALACPSTAKEKETSG